ncbi:DUF596 domain-containing protein [Oligella urethralis]|uniref:DUF596 domain-containing protein n=1 Tax=Oligella urethralis TaxID=90245 RepID=UPI0027B9EEA2|nr:DUF596 domain-containing protein [Oligella urethralis]
MTIIDIRDEVYEELYECSSGMSASALWGEVVIYLGETSPYEDRKQFFLSVMYRLMKEGRLKLAFQGKFLEGTIEEQVALYSERWPKNEADLMDFDFQLIRDFTKEDTLIFWPLCGFVWFYEDGFIEWT